MPMHVISSHELLSIDTCRSVKLLVPEVHCALVNLQGFSMPSDIDKVTQVAYFFRETLRLGACALSQLIKQVKMALYLYFNRQ